MNFKKYLKQAVIVFIFLFFASAAFCMPEITKIFIEGFAADNMYETSSVKAVPSIGNEYNFLSPSFGASLVMLLYTDPVPWAIYIKKDYINFTGSNMYYYPGGQGVSMTAKEDYSVHYLGIGGRWYYFDNFVLNSFQTYIGMDVGLYFGMSDYSTVNYYGSDGSNTGSLNLAPGGNFPGANLNAGFNYWFNSYLGFMGELAFRVCEGSLKDSATNTNVSVNYPGFSIKLGITLNFDSGD